MTQDLQIRIEGRAGRITLTRTSALNALSYDMCVAVDAALADWASNDAVALVIIDAAGSRAFCAGGDVAQIYHTGIKGDFDDARRFWRDEYIMNARIFEYPKPVVSFMQGYVMGGGVGIGCHGSHRIVTESTQMAMPETAIGLVPDVGGSLLLALAPGRLGEYLGTTGARMSASDAIYAGFADHFIPEAAWPALIERLCATGAVNTIAEAAQTPPPSALAQMQPWIDAMFGGESYGDIVTLLKAAEDETARATLARLAAFSPLSLACTVELIHRQRASTTTMRSALELEYRFTSRASEHGDLLEGVRALLIDKDKSPKWQFTDAPVPAVMVSKMLQPLGAEALAFDTLPGGAPSQA